MVSYFYFYQLIDIFNLLFVSKRLIEIVNRYKRFEDRRILAKTVIDTENLNQYFMSHFDKLIIRLSCQFTFNKMLYLRYSLELRVTVGHVLDCLLIMQMILFLRLNITLLAYFQAIMFLIRI